MKEFLMSVLSDRDRALPVAVPGPATTAQQAPPPPAVRPAGPARVMARSSFAGDVAVAAAVAVVAVSPVLGVCWALGDPQVSQWLWTTLGPDTSHSPAEVAADRVCDMGDTAGYDQGRCVIRLAAYGAATAEHFPRAEGGSCELATRFDCARRYGLEQWDGDVPLLQPWRLHNGPAGMTVSAAAGGLTGLMAAAATIGAGGTRTRRYRFAAKTGVAGAGAGLAGMDLIRHQDLLTGLPATTGPVLAGTALTVLAASAGARAVVRRRTAGAVGRGGAR
jgi:hypothetical protein